MNTFWPRGTVYGCLLNFRTELAGLGEQVHAAPYNAPPVAPVLYIKTANTWSANGSAVTLPPGASQLEVGATVAMVIGPPVFGAQASRAHSSVAGYVLANDLSVPHSSFYRPPVKSRCPDGLFGVGPACVPARLAGDPASWVLEVRIGGALRQTVDFAGLLRDAATLLADVSDCMTLQPGDWLLLGCAGGRPLVAAGDHVEIRVANGPEFGVLRNQLVCHPAEAA
jgi:5-oxopent-3-ene-1,2,5-tricarboxylate decarboxylase/2-hydroxyhepta-2,4-diene-1,7-dioate isomerase